MTLCSGVGVNAHRTMSFLLTCAWIAFLKRPIGTKWMDHCSGLRISPTLELNHAWRRPGVTRTITPRLTFERQNFLRSFIPIQGVKAALEERPKFEKTDLSAIEGGVSAAAQAVDDPSIA
jgi:hypothetical protein